MTTILEIEKLNVSYQGTSILQNINMKVEKGEILGIVGESGSGKSTLLKAMIGLLGDNGRVESGRISFEQVDLLRISSRELRNIRGAQLGMVFQNPGMSFNPIRKIGAQFLEALKNHGKIDESQATKQILDMFTRLGLREGKRILNSYPFELSGGMNQRVAIALAMILNPQLLLADEPTSALDVTVQAQCVKEMMDLRQHLGTTIIIVTHNMGVVSHMADKVAVMYAGSIVEYGSKADVLNHPKHPYTKALLSAIPIPDPKVEHERQRIMLSGDVPSPINPAFGEVFTGCSFSPRCSLCDNICTHEKPVMHSGENGHAVFCHKCLSEV